MSNAVLFRKCAENSSLKTSLTLNYKRVPYRTTYIEIKRSSRYSTVWESHLPQKPSQAMHYQVSVWYCRLANLSVLTVHRVIADYSSDPKRKPAYATESVNIAVYLDDEHPAPKYPPLLPVETRALQKIFVDHYFTSIQAPLLALVAPNVPKRLSPMAKEHMYTSRGGK